MPCKVWNQICYPLLKLKFKYYGCEYVSLMGLKLNHVSKRGSRSQEKIRLHLQFFFKIIKKYSLRSNWQNVIFGYVITLASTRRQAIKRTNVDTFNWCISLNKLNRISNFWGSLVLMYFIGIAEMRNGEFEKWNGMINLFMSCQFSSNSFDIYGKNYDKCFLIK